MTLLTHIDCCFFLLWDTFDHYQMYNTLYQLQKSYWKKYHWRPWQSEKFFLGEIVLSCFLLLVNKKILWLEYIVICWFCQIIKKRSNICFSSSSLLYFQHWRINTWGMGLRPGPIYYDSLVFFLLFIRFILILLLILIIFHLFLLVLLFVGWCHFLLYHEYIA